MSVDRPTNTGNPGVEIRPARETDSSIASTAPIRPSMGLPNVTTQLFSARQLLPKVEIPPEAAETAEELFGRLRRLCDEGRVEIDLDNKRLMHIDSPVSFEAWGNQWVYALLLVTGVLWYFFGYKVGLGAAIASVALYLTVAKAFLRRRIERRVRHQVLEDVARWRKLWSFGGVTLREASNSDSSALCVAPKDNWMEFVRGLTRS